IDQECLPSHVAARLRSQKDDRSFKVARFAGTLQRDAVLQVFDPSLVFIKHRVLLGMKPAGSKAIDGDAVLAPVIGETHRKLADAATAGSIGGKTRIPEDAGDRANIDDPAITVRHHAAR